MSETFSVSNGIKQGGLLSPYLFNIYVDCLSKELNSSGVGCLTGFTLVNHLSYADDMVLLAPSKRGLQLLLDLCSSYAFLHNILYNTEKSYCMIYWPKRFLYKFIPEFFLQGEKLDYIDVFKYLGVMLNDKGTDDDEMNFRMRELTPQVIC